MKVVAERTADARSGGRAGEGARDPFPHAASHEARPDGAQPPRSSARVPRG